MLVRSLKPIYSDNATQPFLGKAQDARRVAQIALPSVVLIVAQDANRQPLSQGSGFVVGDGLIATSLHVIEGAYAGSVKFGSKLYPILGIAALDQSRDLAVLSVPGVSGALTIGDTERIAIGDKIYAAGNPMGLEGTISEGIVSGVRDRAKSVLFCLISAYRKIQAVWSAPSSIGEIHRLNLVRWWCSLAFLFPSSVGTSAGRR
jgi:S1-C subfamily serine protease